MPVQSKIRIIVSGDINIIYLNENNPKQYINSLLHRYNLLHTVNFPTRVQNFSSTAIDNNFTDSSKLNSSYTAPLINALSDHDAQFLMLSHINTGINLAPLKWGLRNVTNATIAQFQCLLANEKLKPVLKHWNENHKYNCCLDRFLKIFEASFPAQIKV
jgi:hypothetical protein